MKNSLLKFGRKISSMYEAKPLLFCFVTALITELYTEIFAQHSLIGGFSFVISKFGAVFLFNTLIIFATMAISLLFKKGIAMWTTVFFVWFTLGTANGIILINRPSPFTGSDILILPSVLEILTVYLRIWQIIIIAIAIIAAITGLVMLWIKSPKRKVNYKIDGIKCGALVMLLAITTPVYLATGILSRDYSEIVDAYYKGGFPYSFSRSIFCHGISEPDYYGKDEVNDVINKLEEKRKGATGEQNKDEPNIIYVQLESFFDVTAVKGITFTENPIPNFTHLKNTCPSGFISMPLIGSGTANTEFEILTGMNIDYFAPGEYPYIQVLDEKPCETAASILKRHGYSTHSLHNNTGTFYNRYLVYPNLGFDTFTPIEYMYDIEKNPLGWCKDKVYPDEIMKTLKSTEEKDFVFAVSMQPHGAYPTGQLGDYEIEVQGIPKGHEEFYHIFSYYANQIRETDLVVKQLIDMFEDYEEKTVIVFYGDHLPDLKLHEENLSRGDMHTTEYIIWNNFDMEIKKEAPEKLQAYQLTAYLFELLNIDDGVMNGIHRYFENDPNYQEMIRVMEYDALFGEKYGYSEEHMPKKLDTKYGINPITIDEVKMLGNTITIKGEGFNEYTVIYVNGKKYKTVLCEDGVIFANDIKIKDKMKVKVVQESENGIIFSGTEEQEIKK